MKMYVSRPVPILMYHEYEDSLKQHFEFIKNRGCATVHLRDVASYIEDQRTAFPEKKIILVFDDAYLDFNEKIRPLLDEVGFTATLCVPTGYVSLSEDCRRVGNWKGGSWGPIMTWRELDKLAHSGFEIIPHSVSHISFYGENEGIQNNRDRLRYEIECSKNMIEEQLNITDPGFFCLPYGAGWKYRPEDTVNSTLSECGFKGALRSEYNGEEWNRFCIPRWRGESVVHLLG